MGNFISKAWKDLTGQTAAEKAAKAQQAALDQQKQEADKSELLKKDVLAKYDELMPMIMGMLTGNINPNSNPMTAQSYNILQQVLGNLSGDNKTEEQIRTDNLYNDYINGLTSPYSPTAERQFADEFIDSYISQLTAPQATGKSDEEKTADEWNAKYLSSLANSPDTAFNAGVAELARGAETQNENIRKAMQSRGISSSGINLAALGSTAADRARGVSQLQGQRADRQVQNNGIGAQYATSLADRQRQMANENEDRQMNKYGTAAGILDERAARAEGIRDNQLERLGTAAGISDERSAKAMNDIIQALNTSNNWNQQNWNNLMGLLSGKTSLINNQAGASYAQGLNNLADSYSQQAGNQAGLLGTVGGKFLTSNTGKKLVSQAGTAALGGIQKILGLIGL